MASAKRRHSAAIGELRYRTRTRQRRRRRPFPGWLGRGRGCVPLLALPGGATALRPLLQRRAAGRVTLERLGLARRPGVAALRVWSALEPARQLVSLARSTRAA